MDRSLDELISERPPRRDRREDTRRPPPPRAPRVDEYPRDGVRKPRYDERVNIDSDWVHDRYEDDRNERLRRRPPPDDDRHPLRNARAPVTHGTKIRVDNVHYDLTEADLRELFERIGPTISVKIQYDRHDRSTGTAYVTYEEERDARDAVHDYDGQNANGVPIKLTLVPTEPRGGAPPPRPGNNGGSLFDRIERPPRSLFDRIEGGPRARDDEWDDTRVRRRERSDSPRKTRPAPDHVDRYVPGARDSRSPMRRRGPPPRETGRRPGERRGDSGRGGGAGGGGRRARTDEDGRPLVGGRPRKTAEELDAEMEDYWGGRQQDSEKANGAQNGAAAGDDDIDMIE